MAKIAKLFITALATAGLVGLQFHCGGGGGGSSSGSTNTDVAPSITTHPASQTVLAGNPVTFSIVATGTPAPTYQWKLGTGDITGATSADYTINTTDSSMNGNSYTCTVTNSAGSVTSHAAILTVTTPVAPAFTTHPSDQSVTAGDTATFSVVATGTPAPTYHWYNDDGAITGATSASYTTPATTLAMNGKKYYCVASNSVRAVPSNQATLTVNSPVVNVAPSITTQPLNRTVPAGATATFSVVATGTPAPTYEWKLGTGVITGATSATYTTPATDASMDGNSYTCTVTNLLGSKTTRTAVLSVLPASVTAVTLSLTDAADRPGDTLDLIYPQSGVFTIKATPTSAATPGSFTWYFRADGDTAWNPVPSYTTDTFLWPSGAGAGENGHYYVTAQDSGTSAVIGSNVVHAVVEIITLTPTDNGGGQFSIAITHDTTQSSGSPLYAWFTAQPTTSVGTENFVATTTVSGALTDSGWYFVTRMDTNGARVISHPILIPSGPTDERGILIARDGATTTLYVDSDYTGLADGDPAPYTWYLDSAPGTPLGTGTSFVATGTGNYYVTRTNFAGTVMKSNNIAMP